MRRLGYLIGLFFVTLVLCFWFAGCAVAIVVRGAIACAKEWE